MITTNQKLVFVAINILYLLGVKFSGPPFGNAPFASSYSIVIFGILILVNIALYKALQIESKDGFTFEVTPAKLCAGGPYMYSSNVKRQQMCSEIPEKELQSVTCPYGQVGQPRRVLERSPISDDKWQNNICG